MELKTHRNVVIFDLDGVLVANPQSSVGKGTITDNNYWSYHWAHPDKADLNMEMVALAQSLISSGHQLVILTARPGKYRIPTERLLYRAGIFVAPHPNINVRMPFDTRVSNSPLLVMLEEDNVPYSSAEWKQAMVKKWLDSGNKVTLMVEDHRPNAEAIRCLVPVLLYESKRPSKYIGRPCCGGLAACWCPVGAADVAIARANGA